VFSVRYEINLYMLRYVVAMPGKNLKVQNRLFVREGAPHQQTRNCKKKNQRENGKNWSRVPGGCLMPRQTDRQTVGRNITLTLTRPPLWSNGQSSWLQNGDVLCFL
jgi:hypothetical protein